MRRTGFAAATFSIALTALPALAAPIIHDSVGAFAQLTFSGGGPVPAARGDAANMFDGDALTMRSLGIGGTLIGGIGADRTITSLTLSELTFGLFSNYREQLTLSLALDADGDGIADGDWVEIGVLRNDEYRSPDLPAVTPNPAQSVAALTGIFATGERTDYTITVDASAGQFNLFRLVDNSPFAIGRDGFDVAELRLVSAALVDPVVGIPLPMSLALFGVGLFGLGITSRGMHKAG